MNAEAIIQSLFSKGIVLKVDQGDLVINAPEEALDEITIDLIATFKIELIELLTKLDLANPAQLKIVKGAYPKSYDTEASMGQQRMLFMEELSGNRSYYNIPMAFKIIGSLNKAALTNSLTQLLARHDVLRSTFFLRDNVYVQRVYLPEPFNLVEKYDNNDFVKDDQLEKLLSEERNYPFDLAREFPIRAVLIHCGKDEYVLSINIHHIAADGWSARLILGELSEDYLSNQVEGNIKGTDRPYQYADFVRFHNAWHKTEEFKEAKKYWASVLEGAPELHNISTDYIRPAKQTMDGNTYIHDLGSFASSLIAKSAHSYKTSPFVILQAVFAGFLSRYSGESDILFGTAVAGRYPLEFSDTVGLFVNTVALRYCVNDEASLASLVDQAISVSSMALKFQHVPFDMVVDEIQPSRSLSYSPVIQIMMVMQENPSSYLKLDGATVQQLSQIQEVSKFDIALHIYPSVDDFSINWEYNKSIFKESTIRSMADSFVRLMTECLQFPKVNIHKIPLVNMSERFTSLGKDSFSPSSTIHKLFESHVTERGDQVAISDGGLTVTYQQLNQCVNRVAAHLDREAGGLPVRIGVYMEKSAELIIGLLSVLKVGAVYVPLDPSYPHERLEWMIEDSDVTIILTSDASRLPFKNLSHSKRILSVETLMAEDLGVYKSFEVDFSAPAYIIYTSGSTGRPKGVSVSHRSLFHSLMANQSVTNISSEDIVPTIGSQAFGISLLEILLPLISGGGIRIVKKNEVTDLQKLLQVTDKVTVFHAVPSLMRKWLDVIESNGGENYPNLRLVLVGGEPVPQSLLKRIQQWRQNIQILELYGMTESAVVCSSYDATLNLPVNYCIGTPHSNSYFYVLNRHGQIQPQGVPGELCIGGISLADEYINQPNLTREKFITVPFIEGTCLYKTGDYVKPLANDYYEFLGRIDHQVSLRGARVELGEIEVLAMEVIGVTQAVAHLVTISFEEESLVLSYTSISEIDENSSLDNEIRKHLSNMLPDHMRPSIIQRLQAFPLNPNGKMDRKNIPLLKSKNFGSEPKTEIEKSLHELWTSVFQREFIGVTENFFEIGGHSLMVAKMAAKIRSNYDVSVPLTVFFDAPNIRGVAAYIEATLAQKYVRALTIDPNESVSENEELII